MRSVIELIIVGDFFFVRFFLREVEVFFMLDFFSHEFFDSELDAVSPFALYSLSSAIQSFYILRIYIGMSSVLA